MTSRALLFGLNCYLASVAALYIAFCFELPNPWWSAVTVFITSQPMTGGAISAKAIHRIGGTLVGLAVALLVIPNLVDAPELMMLALAIWLSVCLFIALQMRTPANYLVLLAGYSAALVGLPIIDDPSAVFDTAIARTEEILIGVTCAATVHSVIFPLSSDDVWTTKLHALLGSARSWIPKAMRGSQLVPYEKGRLSYPSDVVELAVMGEALRFEPRSTGSRSRATFALESCVFALLPLAAGVEYRVLELEKLGEFDERARSLLGKAAGWIGLGEVADPRGCAELLEACEAASRPLWGASAWADLVRISLFHRLAQLLTEWRACIVLARYLGDSEGAIESSLDGPFAAPRPHALHADSGLALVSALSAGATLLVVAAFAMIVRWPVATTGIGLSAVMTSLFATADDPTPLQGRFLVWNFLSIPIATFYVYAVLPTIDGFAQLTIVLFPLIFTIGVFMAIPKHLLRALAAGLVVTTLIGLQPVYRTDFTVYSNQVLSGLLGTFAALVMTQVFRVFNADWVRGRIERATRQDLLDLVSRTRHHTSGRVATTMLDRVGMITSRLGPALPDGQVHIIRAMRNLHLGVNLVEILDAAPSLPKEEQLLIRALQGDFQIHLASGATQTQSQTRPDAVPVARAFAKSPRTTNAETGLSAAVGLQLAIREEGTFA